MEHEYTVKDEDLPLSLDSRAKALGLNIYDTSLPQSWVDELHNRLEGLHHQNWNPYGQFVWCYDNASIFGYPVALTSLAALILYRTSNG